MLFPRRFSAGLKVSLPIAGAALALLCSAAASQAEGLFGTCGGGADIAVLAAPLAPWAGAPLRVLVAAEKPLGGELTLTAPDGRVVAQARERPGGPPYIWYAEVAAPAAGTWRATLSGASVLPGCGGVTREIAVGATRPAPPRASAGSVWPLRNSWNRGTEDLYSAWIAKLFDGPLGKDLSWPSLQVVLRDRSRNMLFDYLGLNEDRMGIVFRPDCADLPYFLRTYFAFKMGLPFGYSKCSRGGGGRPPRCYSWTSMLEGAGAQEKGLVSSFSHYLRAVADGVQSGNGRTLDNDDNTDFYPIPLSQETLRPGAIYADPYGHILMLVRRVAQVGGAAGIFLAVDAEPDGTVTRKRFWRGNFLFAHEPGVGGPGFKRFRPIVRTSGNGMRRLSNAEIARDGQYGDFSLEQSRLSVEDFYDRMDDVMSPAPLDPQRAMEDAITSLDEQVKTRVVAVENGRKFQMKERGEAVMPDGAAIFETNGAWEDFATPARDFRLLVAIDVVRGFPDRVARRAQRYKIPFGKSVAEVRAALRSVLASELAARKFTYTRSDGSQWTLTLKDVVDRESELEMAYNLNDCVELRWGAAPNSQEAATCRRHAPSAQRAKMSKYRPWFHDRHWPTHA